MAPPQDRSCYVLELSVQPGGSRWAELHAYSNLDHIRACLDVFLENGGGTSAYHAIGYGATLGIWTVQHGDVVGFVDLHSLIQIRHRDKPPLSLADEPALRAFVYERRLEHYREEGADEEEEEIPDADDWDDYDLTTYEEMTMELDWAAVAARLSPLEPPVLAPGGRAKVRHDNWKKSPRSMYAQERSVRFGSYEVENGDRLEPPFEIEGYDDDEDDEDDEDEHDEG
jgi:hypothetical protein